MSGSGPGFRLDWKKESRDARDPCTPMRFNADLGRVSMAVQSTEWCAAERLWGTCRRITAVVVAAISPVLLANTITVDDASSGSVPGKCTVQDAFVAANTNATVNGCSAGSVGVDTIVFAPGITNIVLADRFPPGFGSYALEAQEDLIVDGGAVAGSGVPVVTITRDTTAGVPVFGMIFASGHGGGAGPSFNFTLKGVTITGGVGAGVVGDNVTVNDSVIDGNQGGFSNGGIAADTLTITDSTVSNNSFGQGAGISANTLTLSNTTVSGNSGDPGGIWAGTATLTNATISGNTAAGAGSTAGISLGSGTLKFVTITANAITGGAGSNAVGLLTGTISTLSLSHVVIAGNLGGAGSFDVGASFRTLNSIVGDHSWIGSLDINAQGSLASGVLIASCASTNLGPLANNGGGKATHALLSGSCLINAGDVCAATALPFDERGAGFNRCMNLNLDIGAFESQAVTLLASATALVSSLNPANVGQSVTFTANVTGGGGTPTGTVTFMDGAATLGTGTLNGAGLATFTTSALAVGTHPVTAVYGGDATYAGSTSGIVNQAISPLASATALVSSLNPANVGQSVTFTANVTGSGGTPTGNVTFMDGAATLGTGTLNGAGLATFTTSAIAVGTHPVAAVYGGDATYAGSTSGLVNQMIVGAGLLVFTGNTATGTGAASVTMTTASGGAACGFTSGAFVPVSSVPIAPPAGAQFPQGLVNFQIGNCATTGISVTLTLTFPQPLPAGAVYWKYGPATKGAAPTWYMLPGANVAGNQITFTLTDGQQGDDDWSVNGVLADPVGRAPRQRLRHRRRRSPCCPAGLR